MAQDVEFGCPGGGTAGGYLATATSGSGPGVLVIQEWWGLVPQIKAVCDRLAGEGFTALAPDLYHGDVAEHTEMDKAGELMTKLPMDRAANDMTGAIDFLREHQAVAGDKVGVVGFCMGGMLTFVIAAIQGDKIGAAVAFYGAPLDPSSAPDWSGLSAPVLAHAAEKDSFFPPQAIEDLAATLRDMGKDVTVEVYPGTGHAFANEHDPLKTYDAEAADLAWSRTLAFLRSNLGA